MPVDVEDLDVEDDRRGASCHGKRGDALSPVLRRGLNPS